MKKAKWIVGLSLSGVLVISSAVFALSPGTNSINSQKQGIAQKLPVETANTQTNSVKATANSVPVPQKTANSVQYNNSSLPQVPSVPYSPNQNPGFYNGGYGMNGYRGAYGSDGYGRAYGAGGYGMMGGYGINGNRSYGMMGGYAGGNYGCFGGGYDASSLGIKLTNGVVENSDQALAIAQAYVKVLNQGFKIDELHEFADSYEVEVSELNTGIKAYEFMIDKSGGYIYSEMGPNAMWNTKYGHMNWGNVGSMTISSDQATQAAKAYVSQMGQPYSLEENPEQAPGYYEFMILMNDKDYAELDVNGYTGQVWFENWHGPIVNTVENDEISTDQAKTNS